MPCETDLISRAEKAISDLEGTPKPEEEMMDKVRWFASCLMCGLHYPDMNPAYRPSNATEKTQYAELALRATTVLQKSATLWSMNGERLL